MAASRTVSPLMAAIGADGKQYIRQHANDEVRVGIINLPAGINNGVAKLTKAYFKQYKDGPNAGQWFFRAEGAVEEPEYHERNGQRIKVRGLQTSIMEAACETKTQSGKITTKLEHIDNIINHMKALGADPSEFVKDDMDLDRIAAALVIAAPYFRFTTSPKFDQATRNPDGSKIETGTWENWHGIFGVEDYVPGEGGGPVDNTVASATPEAPAAEAEGYDDGMDLPTLVANAPDSEAAQNRLRELFEAAGYSSDEWDAITGWDGVRDAILNPKTGDDEPAPEDEVEVKKDEVYGYKVIDPKTKKPMMDSKSKKERKPIEVTVVSSDKKSKKAKVKSLEDNKTVYEVTWADLIVT